MEEYRVVLNNAHALEKFARSLDRSNIPAEELEYHTNLKFYFAGISARFFFDYRITQIKSAVKSAVEHCLRSVDSFDELLKGYMGTACSQAVNVLFYNVDGSMRFSSRFIVDEILRRNRVGPRTFIDMAAKLGFNPNRGAVGLLFESYTLTLIHRSGWDPLQDVISAYAGGCPYLFSPTKTDAINILTNFYMGANDEAVLEKWYKAFKPSNPGFDAFYAFGKYRKDDSLLEDLVIVFLQVTCGKTYSFNSQHFATAARSISSKIKGFVGSPDNVHTCNKERISPEIPNYTKLFIEIVFAVPSGRKSTFSVDTLDVLASLEKLDRRWSSQISVIAEVPDSEKFL